MLSQRSVYATIPASDVSRAQRWYEEKLGFTPRAIGPSGTMYDAGGETGFPLLLPPPCGCSSSPGNCVDTFASDLPYESDRLI